MGRDLSVRRRRRRFDLGRFVLGLALTLLIPGPLLAQTIDPNVIQFLPSPDHWAVRSDGQPVVSKYVLTFYQYGGVDAVMQLDLGKPAPQADGMIRVDYNSMFGAWPLPNTSCDARVSAVGPDGQAVSVPSNAFVYNCTVSLSFTTASASAAGGSGSVQVSTGSHCGWTATSSVSWITVTSSSGVGAGTVAYQVAANSGGTRSGTVTVGGATLTITQAGTGNSAPTVTLTSPVNGASYATGASITVSASAADSDGTIAKVDFFSNGTLVKSVATSPYSFSWSTSVAGSYALYAVAYDNAGASTRSASSTITVASTSTLTATSTATATYLSDRAWTSATNGYGPVERDMSNGEDLAGDGHTITLNGVAYAKGLGTHATSDIRYALNGACTKFTSVVGVDDEVGSNGTVVFQVWTDGTLRYDSGVMTGAMPGASVSVDVTGVTELQLLVTPSTDGSDYDHGDWANAQVTCASAGPYTVRLSDLGWKSMVNGWGPAERDMSNGGTAAGDGHTITLNGKAYAKGLGVHAASDIRFALNGACSVFNSDVGVDDEVGSKGSIVFQVWADGTKLFDSGLMKGNTATQPVLINVAGRNELALVVTDGGNGNGSDHGDWADARVTCSSPPGWYVSDLAWTSMTNGWGPAERDMSNGENLAGDGHTLTLNGQTYPKGVGAHASSDVQLPLGGVCSAFQANVGVDDEVGSSGSVVFQVWADGTKLFDSGLMTGTSATQAVQVGITGRTQLDLVVTDGGDGNGSDHADWAAARLTCTQKPAAIVQK